MSVAGDADELVSEDIFVSYFSFFRKESSLVGSALRAGKDIGISSTSHFASWKSKLQINPISHLKAWQLILADYELIFFLLWHMISVYTWLGMSWVFAFVILPALQTTSQEKRSPILRLMLPSFSRMISAASVSALVAGALLFGYVSSVGAYKATSGWNLFFIIVGAVMGIVAAILTLGVLAPLVNKFTKQVDLPSNLPSQVVGRNSIASQQATLKAVKSVLQTIAIMLIVILSLMTLGVFF